ncbi:alpha/beta fold hydrolase [Noviherbaspirillum massiliense]|uniref:alpha/beta fold hydrolase n=1 Tax=Noviherbaspirillum massiliense TaxID=1465823 RepID=UPI0002D65548|nr:alpha/beta fold hydrolase [Noviherbaspirillum massiliense]
MQHPHASRTAPLDKPLAGIDVRHERIRGDGVELHVAITGDGPPVILLHGFPENWRSWQHQIAPLVAAGYSVWMPDLRGYNLSDMPPTREAYRLRHLVADVAMLAEGSGHPRVHLVGHDWGGIIAWAFAAACPALLDKLVILNAPHMRIYRDKLWRSSQLLRSWYVLFFQLPFLPERALSQANYRAVRRIFEKLPARHGTFSAQDVDAYIDGLARPGALTAALNYYRAGLRSGDLSRAFAAPIEARTLVIWGERDPALGSYLLDGLERFVPHLQVHRIPGASHWVQNEAPDQVNRALLDFLGQAPAGAA